MSAPRSTDRLAVVALAITVEGGLILIAFAAGWLLRQPPLDHFEWAVAPFGIGIAATLPLYLFFRLLLVLKAGPTASIRKFSLEVLCPMLAPCTVPDLLAIALLAGVSEEMLFRGVFQEALIGGAGVWWGVFSASLLFGMLHATTPAYAIMATLMGAYLGVLFLLTGNLLAPIVVHALYDFVALYHLLYRMPGTAQQSD